MSVRLRRYSTTRTAIVAVGVLVAFAALAVGAAAFSAASVQRFGFAPLNGLDAGFALTYLTFALVGAFVAARRPANPVPWLFCAAGLLGITGSFARAYASYALFAEIPGAAHVAGLQGTLSALGLIAIFIGLTLFPSGALPSSRWRPAAWVILSIIGLISLVSFAAAPTVYVNDQFPEIDNPFFLATLSPYLSLAVAPARLAAVPLALLPAAVVVTRLRRSSGIERQQLKWVAYTGTLSAMLPLVIFLLAWAMNSPSPWGLTILLPVLFAGIPISAGIAILRHRLYDIDVLINRTLVYGATTATLVATYALGVLAAHALLRPFTQGNELAVAVSTLAVAALIQPVRRRIQSAVDRRFYRSRYDAARTLDAFGTRLRDEVDIDALRHDLIDVVRDTMEPAHASVWLRRQ